MRVYTGISYVVSGKENRNEKYLFNVIVTKFFKKSNKIRICWRKHFCLYWSWLFCFFL